MKSCSVIVAATDGLAANKFFFTRLFRETRAPFELIVVDNGTTDGTASYLNDLTNRKLIRFPVNMGLSKAWNSALRLTSGDMVAFVGTPCILPTGWLANLSAELTAKKQIGMVQPVDRGTVLKYRPLFIKEAEFLDKVPAGGFTSEAELDRAYKGGFNDFAASFSSRQGEKRITSSSAFCFLVKSSILHKKAPFPEGYQNNNAPFQGFADALAASGLRALVTAKVYTHS